MMSGGIFMMGFGLIVLFLLVAIPVVLIGVLVWAFTRNPNPAIRQPMVPFIGPAAGRFCSHCGAGLQDGWSHCPQCGAPVGSGAAG